MEHLFKLKKDGKTVGYEQSILQELMSGTEWAYKAMITQQRFPDGKWFDVLMGMCHLKSILHDEKCCFVTKDKNGKDVFAGDRIKRVNYTGDPQPREVAGQEGIVVWHHGFLQWSLKVGSENSYLLNDLVDSEIFEDGIELIEEKEDE